MRNPLSHGMLGGPRTNLFVLSFVVVLVITSLLLYANTAGVSWTASPPPPSSERPGAEPPEFLGDDALALPESPESESWWASWGASSRVKEAAQPASPPDPTAPLPADPQQHRHPVPIVTVGDEARFQQLRELVGSVHYFRSGNLDVPLVTVCGFNLSEMHKREIRLWRNVELEDFSETLFLGPRGVPPYAPDNRTGAAEGNATAAAPQLDSLAVVASAVSLALRKHSSAVYIDASLRFVSGGPGGGEGNQMFAQLEKLVVDGPDGAVVLDVEKSAAPSAGQDGGDASQQQQQQQQQQQHDDDGGGDDGAAPRAFALRAGSEFANYFVDYELQCVRNYQCSPSVRRALRRRQRALLAQLSRPALTFGLNAQLPGTDSTFCYMLLRDDILYSEVMVEHYLPNSRSAVASEQTALPPVSSVDGAPRKRMAFLIATVTTPDVQSPADVAVLRRLLPSVITTLSEEEMRRFEIVVYIGFDEGDRYWDDPSTRRELDGMMKSVMFESGVPERQAAPLPADKAVVHFRYVRLPFSKGWVTYVWNGLFVKAYHDGCDFFFQINDDCTFETAGWLTALTAPLSAPPDDPSAYPVGFGVAGPPDLGHAGRIFTQAVVSRVHYEIFGRLYPIDIKDWYSDDWITQVYGDLGRHRVEGTVVKNWNDNGTRYNVCPSPRYEEVLSRSKPVVQKWLDRWRATRDGTVAEDNAMVGVEILVQ